MNAQMPNIINFFVYLGTAVPLIAFGIYIFIRTTPYDDFALMRCGSDVENVQHANAALAASYDIGGKIIGLTLVLASAIVHAINIVDLILWGILGIIFEVAVFCLFRYIVPLNVIEEIPKGNISIGLFSSILSIASGLILAALLSY